MGRHRPGPRPPRCRDRWLDEECAAGGPGTRAVLDSLTPGIPGDSGSAFLNSQGQALGVLSTVAIAPLPASNGVGDVGRELAYAQAHGHPGLQLVNGTEPFKAKLFGYIG